MRIAICDDKNLHLKYTYQLVTDHFKLQPEIEIEMLSPEYVKEHIERQAWDYDLFITDIDLGAKTGIEFAKELQAFSPNFFTIFISSYLDYATEVYDTEHIYFVLKLQIEERLPKALDKAVELYNKGQTEFLAFRFQSTNYNLPLRKISHIEAMGRYVYIYIDTEQYRYIYTLKKLIPELPSYFGRCHKSYIVNLSKVKSMRRTDCVLVNDFTIPISQTYAQSFQQTYLKYMSGTMSS